MIKTIKMNASFTNISVRQKSNINVALKLQ